jgi:hypothetical protein
VHAGVRAAAALLAGGVGAAIVLGGGDPGGPARPAVAADRAGAAARGQPPADLYDPGLPAPVAPAFQVRTPDALTMPRSEVHWAPVERPVTGRRRPGAGAPADARIPAWTPERTRNIVLVGGERRAGGRLWVRVRPDGDAPATWVPRGALGGYVFVRTRMLIDRRARVLSLLRDGREVFRARIGVGAPGTPTPAGRFYVRNKLTRFASPFYGPIAFGTSARSRVLTDWPLGGYVGIHGTNRPDLIPGAVSHGCVRLRNGDILRLARLLPIGTPITIV